MSDIRKQILLGNVGPVRMCKRILKSQTSETAEIPFYKISTFGSTPDTFIDKTVYDEFRTKYSFPKKGEILISAAGTVGKTVAYDGSPAYFQDSNIVWIENDESKILNKYLYYFYQTKPWLTTNGSTIKRIYNDDLRNIKISFPDIPAQHKISTVLNDLDTKIDLNNKINAELEAMAKLIYDYWFVQFDFPDENGKPYKSSGGKMIWNKELKREIPEGWKVEKLEKIFTFETGIEPGSSAYLSCSINEHCVKFFRVGDIEGKSSVYVDLSNKMYVTVEERDIVVTFDGSVGKLGFGLNGAFSSGLRKIYDKSKQFDNSLIYFIFKDERIIATIHKYATGSILLHASSSISHLKIPFEKNVYLKFQEAIKSMFDQMVINKQENQKLAELRDWLLPMLMNGQVKIK